MHSCRVFAPAAHWLVLLGVMGSARTAGAAPDAPEAVAEEPSEDRHETSAAHTHSILVDDDETRRLTEDTPGGRRWVATEGPRASGASQVLELFEQEPAAMATAGNAGLGSTSTKLNIAGRGVNPRFSSRTAVYLDGLPIATAPYGRPQLSLFPLAMFSIAAVAVDLHGVGPTVGPHNSGGVINFIPRPIPETPTLSAMVRANHWGGVNLGAAYSATHGKLGLHVEYAPQLGRDYRERSGVGAHGGLIRLVLRPNRRLRLDWLSHGYYERVEIPGGVSPASFAADRRASQRSEDEFGGHRIGTALRMLFAASDRTELSLMGYANWTDRESAVAKGRDGDDLGFKWQRRKYQAFGFEPRVVHDLFQVRQTALRLNLGVRGSLELAQFGGREREAAASTEVVIDRDDTARILAFAPYLGHELSLWRGRVVWEGGYRVEGVLARRVDLLASGVVQTLSWAFLPSQVLRWQPNAQVGVSLGWGRSFGPPQFLQLSVGETSQEFLPERGDAVDLSLILRELAGFEYDLSFWHKRIRDLADVSLEDLEQPGDSVARGIEQRLHWSFAGLSHVLRGLTARYADTWTFGRIRGGAFAGRKLPWYPVYAATAGLGYTFDFGLALNASLRHIGSHFSDYANTEKASDSGGVGRIPAFTLVDAALGFHRTLRSGTELSISLGVRNIADVPWFSRTDDRNAGILALPGRSFFVDLELRQLLTRASRSGR